MPRCALSPTVARRCPIDVAPRMVPTVQDVSYFRPRDPATEWPVLIEWLEHMWYAAPGGDGPGIKVGRHMAGRAVNPSDGPFETLDEFQRDCAEYVRNRCPGLEPEPVQAETCLYTMTADEDFVLDRVGPIVVGGGCSGHGFKFGPLLARSSPTSRPTAIRACRAIGFRRSARRSRAPSRSDLSLQDSKNL